MIDVADRRSDFVLRIYKEDTLLSVCGGLSHLPSFPSISYSVPMELILLPYIITRTHISGLLAL